MELIYAIIGAFILLVLLGIYFKLSAILTQMSSQKSTFMAYGDEHLKQQRDLLDQQNYTLQQITENIESLKDDVNDMKFVSDVFYKYKLPNKKECDLFDQIEIDNEFSEGLNRSRQNIQKSI